MQSEAPMEIGASTVETIGPSKAKIYLRNQAPNRLVNESLVIQYAIAMLDDEWRNTGDPIKFDEKGRLIDGQHRLRAIVESETEQRLSIARNVPYGELLTILDTGRKRNAGDVLTILTADTDSGYTFVYPRNLPSVAKMVMTFYKLNDMNRNSRYTATLSTTAIVNFCKQNQNALQDACRFQARIAHVASFTMNKSALAASIYVCHEVNPAMTESFVNELVRPQTTEGNPAYVLREQAMRDNNKRAPSWTKDTRLTAAYFIKAFNAYVEGRSVATIRFKAFGDAMEEFPQPLAEEPF